MRRNDLATLISSTLLLIACGCHQATGPTGVGMLSPVGSLAPVSPGQSPALGPFGGPTRVTPPGTGAFSTPNNYLGGVIPNNQARTTIASGGVLALGGAPGNSDVIGSGVQVAGWTETNSQITSNSPDSQQLGSPVIPQTSVRSSNSRDPRSGGMQVIDLTGAPNPPGYRPSNARNFNPAMYAQPYAAAVYEPATNQAWQPSDPPLINPQPATNNLSPNPVQVASHTLTPMPQPPEEYPINAPRFQSNFPGVSSPAAPPLPASTPIPSTTPIPSAAQPKNLSWRRPGTQY